MSDGKPMNVLFLCTGNSARSIMAEAYLNARGGGRFRAFSAGSHPTGRVNPLALDTLKLAGIPAGDPGSKSWERFAEDDAPRMDFVITVCDDAAGEACPHWPGQPVSAHWGFEDPAAFEGSPTETSAKFHEIFRQIRRRIDLLVALPMAALDRLALKRSLDDIGRHSS